MDLKNIRTILKMRRIELKKSQEELGTLLGIKKASYGKKENGVTPFTMEEIKIVCSHLGLDFADINSSLPMQTKTALVGADEYVKLTNQLLASQNEITELRNKVSELKNEISGLSYRNKADIFSFFENQVKRMQDAYGQDYKLDWIKVAKAANIEQADKFLHQYGAFKATETSQFLQQTETKNQLAPDLATQIKMAAALQGLTPFAFLQQELNKVEAKEQPSHAQKAEDLKKA